MKRLAVTIAAGAIGLAACGIGQGARAQQGGFSCQPFAGKGNFVNACVAINQAYQAVLAAQANNGYQLGGHADRAKALLQQAYGELLAGVQTIR